MSPKVKFFSLLSDEGPHLPLLQEHGWEVVKTDRTVDLYTEQGLINELAGCSAVIAGSEPYTRKVLESSPQLRVITRAGVGYDAVDTVVCDERQIVVATTPGVNHHSVAEQTMALLFGVARGFPGQDQAVRSGQWYRKMRPRVMGSTLGIVGLGRIGQAVATRAVGLGLHVLAVDPFPNSEFVNQWKIEMCELTELLNRSDYVSLHLPLSKDRYHLMNRERFAQMKPRSVFINTSRGGLVDEEALVEALKAGHLRGAGLDVFETEPLPLSSPLLGLPEVLLSGHVAGLDAESQRDAMLMCADTIISLHEGRWPSERIQNLKHITQWKW